MIEVRPWLKQLIQVLRYEKLRDNHKKMYEITNFYIYIQLDRIVP